ncbi:MAG: phenylalanine--tRNA ligase subunit beta [Syntrophobacteraceae bacterium]|nr:phenylalanine--tRNA ligase subunit beta [Syntrophobacteraceae bacterium]
MIVSLNWLRNYVDIPLTVEELVHRLTMVGLEVEGVRDLGAPFHKVVTARIEAILPHPRADRLRLCELSSGRESFRVVCGAPNIKVGGIVPLALEGAKLPGGTEVRAVTIRGETSRGMLCSQKELALGEDASGIWILPSETPVGIPLSRALELEDTVLEIGVTPNRGDCLCMVGVAREIAAVCKSRLRYPPSVPTETGPPVDELGAVDIEDPEGCPRYAARILEGITVGPSPSWLRRSLESVGVRSINNIVDITNYILMELGQPLHAFDLDRLAQHRIVVRRARRGEKFITLDGVERTLFDDTLLICDAREPVAIAGIMGGLYSEITPQSTRVLIESAYFQPQGIRRSSRKLGLRTESSFRFERGIDPEGVIRAVDRAARLMQEVGGGRIATGRIDVYPSPQQRPVIELRADRVNRFLGTQLETSRMVETLQSIEMDVEQVDEKHLRVVPPSFRPDVTREADLAEEVARLVGYDEIPVTMPQITVGSAPLDPHMKLREEARTLLQGCGFFEVLTYSFISADSLIKLRFQAGDPRLNPVPILNPLSEDQGVMRTTLIPGLLQTARYNFDHRNEDLRIFELSKVFLKREGDLLADEPHRLAGLMAGKRVPHLLYGGPELVDFTDAKGVVEELLDLFRCEDIRYTSQDPAPFLDPYQSATILCGDRCVGSLGRLHGEVQDAFELRNPVFVFDLDFELLFSHRGPPTRFRPLPKFPSVARDMAVVVDEELPAKTIRDFILLQREPLMERVEIFDIYRHPRMGTDRKSLGFRVVYRAQDRSLTDDEVNEIHAEIVRKVLDEFNATLR